MKRGVSFCRNPLVPAVSDSFVPSLCDLSCFGGMEVLERRAFASSLGKQVQSFLGDTGTAWFVIKVAELSQQKPTPEEDSENSVC